MTTIAQQDLFEFVQAPIDVPALHRRARGADVGAIVVFDGFVRNESHGRATKYLDYEAYEPMALGKMREIGAQLHQKFAIHRVAIVHRLGRLGEDVPAVAELDLNPVLGLAEGCVAVDARIRIRRPEAVARAKTW